MTDRQAEQLVAVLHQLEEGGELDHMVEMFTDGAELQNPTDGEPHQGRQGAQAPCKGYRKSLREIPSEFRKLAGRATSSRT